MNRTQVAILLLLNAFLCGTGARFKRLLYNTKQSSDFVFEYDCFTEDHSSNTDISETPSSPFEIRQRTAYCIRPSDAEDDDLSSWEINKDIHRTYENFTFEELFTKQKKTSEMLLRVYGYTAIDKLERYTVYLNSKNGSMSKEYILYCQGSWFGNDCQYMLDGSYKGSLFWTQQSPHNTYDLSSNLSMIEMTCYTHLRCNRGMPPACLDWREICDGKVDCANDDENDESFCEELVTLECGSDEYRCRNGQCIPRIFFQDDPVNPDCQDRSDEVIANVDQLDAYPNGCEKDPAFRCEEIKCNSGELACGDGQCVTKFTNCYNQRGHLFIMDIALVKEKQGIAAFPSIPFECDTHLDRVEKCGEPCWGSRIYICSAQVAQLCASTIFKGSFVQSDLADHLHIFYNNNPKPPKISWVIVPISDCDNDTDCSEPEFYGDYPAHQLCQFYGPRLSLKYLGLYSRSDLSATFYRLLSRRWTEANSSNSANNSSISANQWVNVISEMVRRELEVKAADCAPPSDQTSSRTFQYFQLCNGISSSKVVLVDGRCQNDETDCENWPCANIYTRCDGYANCPDGSDESNCSIIRCYREEHLCVTLRWRLECISQHRIGDSKLDCIGGTDEDSMYRPGPANVFQLGFLCLTELMIIPLALVCDGTFHCRADEDETLCHKISPEAVSISIFCAPVSRPEINMNHRLGVCQNIDRYRATSYFSLFNAVTYPKIASTTPIEDHSSLSSQRSNPLLNRTSMGTVSYRAVSSTRTGFYCHRGFGAYVRNSSNNRLFGRKCFCPPSYYGSRCQYQNDRVALTLRLRSIYNHRTIFIVLIRLMGQQYRINSYHTFHYLSSVHCDKKFNIYLLYSTLAKDWSESYSVHIDLFRLDNLAHHASWYLPIHFFFLPVTRIATMLQIPIESASPSSSQKCALQCKYGQCVKYENSDQKFCLCKRGWSGLLCETRLTCECSDDSLCAGYTNGQPICLCPNNKVGPKCVISSMCSASTCSNGGLCIPLHESDRLSGDHPKCVCTEEYTGFNCEHRNQAIAFEFVELPSYPFMIVHLIEIFPDESHTQKMMFSKIPLNHKTTVLYINHTTNFNIIIVQFNNLYYLPYLRKNKLEKINRSLSITSDQQCPDARTLVDSALAKVNLLKLVKQYPKICLQRVGLACFHDERFMCLCTTDRFANCFQFEHKHDITCMDENPCENEGRCFQDRPKCPSTTECICPECYYGTRCQFSTTAFGISLDAIIGYQIQPGETLFKQPTSIKVTMVLTIHVLAFGLVSDLLSVITFQSRRSRGTGCGNYLLASSVSSLIAILMLAIKVLFLLLAQMAIVTHPSFLLHNCLWMDTLTAIFLNWNAWLNACVAVERTFYVIKGVSFDKGKSKRVAKRIILFLLICVILTYLQDPLHRTLLNDKYERRIWCIIRYPESLKRIASSIVVFHFMMPFAINVISIIVIVILTARQRFVLQKKDYRGHVLKQLQLHRNLVISTGILVLLSVPRLLLASLSDCMKSTRDPWLFLGGYFISFLPPVLIFPIFILTSHFYRQEYQLQKKQLVKKLMSICYRY